MNTTDKDKFTILNNTLDKFLKNKKKKIYDEEELTFTKTMSEVLRFR